MNGNHTDQATPAGARPLVLYDGVCPMCSREIAHYRRLRGADAIDWLDIAADGAPLEVDGIKRDDALARFHVRGSDGHWHSGAFGFVELWRHLPGYRWLARGLRATRATVLLDVAYTRFARWRLARQHGASDCDHCVATGPGADELAPRARHTTTERERPRQSADDATG